MSREVTQAEVRARAVELGLDPDRAVADGLRGAWLRPYWEALVTVAFDTYPEAAERLRSTRLRFNAELAFAARATKGQQAYSVRVSLGIVEALAECARIIAGVVNDPTVAGARSQDNPVEEAGLRLAHVLGWLTSKARSPIGTPGHDLGPRGETWATGITVGAVVFVLAHELGHVIDETTQVPIDSEEAQRNELAADAVGVNLLRGMATSELLTHAPMPLHLTLPAAAMFLSFEGLRQRAVAAQHYAAGANSPATLEEATTGIQHPSPYLRLKLLRSLAELLQDDGISAQGVQAFLDGFDALLPAVQRNMPEWELDTEELQVWMATSGLDPAMVPLGARMSFREAYTGMVLHILQDAAARGRIEDHELAGLSQLAARMPRPVIDLLCDALTGQLAVDHGLHPDVQAIAHDIAHRIGPLPLRLALTGDPTRLIHHNLLNLDPPR